MASNVLSGARAKLGVGDGKTTNFVGIFSNVSFGLTFDAQPVYILGRYAPAEIDYTAQEPVHVTATGWRVFKKGAHSAAKVPKLQDLLKSEYLTLTIEDRQNPGTAIATIRDVRPLSYTTTINSRSLEEITVTFTGIYLEDEDGAHHEEATGFPGLVP